MRCLIVEDDPVLATQLDRAMTDGGFACDIAGDGTQGEYLGATESYDLAILDLGLPTEAVSSVDGADRPPGRLAVVAALREQAAGGAGQYGTGPGNEGPLYVPPS